MFDLGDDPMNPDYLLPELRPYYEPKGSLGAPMLRSPLVYQVPFFYSWKMANMQYTAKLAHIQEYMAAGKYSSAIWLYEKPYRMTMLMNWWHDKVIDLDILKDLLPEVWVNTEHPRQFGYSRIVKLFRATGYLTDAPDHQPPDSILIFRGCQPKDKRGISWTFNPRKADWFARRLDHRGTAKVYKARVRSKKGILGVFLSRDEDEVVVDPRYLIDVEEMS